MWYFIALTSPFEVLLGVAIILRMLANERKNTRADSRSAPGRVTAARHRHDCARRRRDTTNS